MATHAVRRALPRLLAVALALVLYGFSRLPAMPAAEREALAGEFAFERLSVGVGSKLALGQTPRRVREVHPALRHIASWISSVGASVALGDVDRDGLANDYCLVDPRSDHVLVGPLPGTGRRYPAFTLAPEDDDPAVAPMGCRFGDFNEDAVIDVLVYYWGRTPLVFLHRAAMPGERTRPAAGGYRAVDVAPGAGRWNTNALTTADVDGDGHVDLIVGNYFPDGSLPLDAAAAPGTPFSMQNSMARAFNGGRNRILRWRGATAGAEPEVMFEEAGNPFPDEVARGWTLAAAAADLDGDLLPEIYFANDFGPDRLLHNRSAAGTVTLVPVEGRRGFTTPRSKVLGRDSFKGMGVDVGDLNSDGVLDLFVSNIANEHALEESHFAFIGHGDAGARLRRGEAPFVDASEPLGLSRSTFTWEARLADLNNDGVPEALQAAGFIRGDANRWPELQELAMSNNLTIENPANWPRFAPGDDITGRPHNPFFVRAAGGRFVDLAHDVGLGHSQVARGIAVADIDADGDLDFAVARQWEPSDFFRNENPTGRAGLGLRLLVPVERPAAGAEGQPASELVTAEGMYGAQVENWLVLFAPAELSVEKTSYEAPREASHLLLGVRDGAIFDILVDGERVRRATSTREGVLRFDLTRGGEVEVQRVK